MTVHSFRDQVGLESSRSPDEMRLLAAQMAEHGFRNDFFTVH